MSPPVDVTSSNHRVPSPRTVTLTPPQAEARLTVSHKATSIRAACMGMGFAWYPEDWIRDERANGQLKPLPLKEGAERWGAMYLVYPDPDGAGPGARRLGQIIQEEARAIA